MALEVRVANLFVVVVPREGFRWQSPFILVKCLISITYWPTNCAVCTDISITAVKWRKKSPNRARKLKKKYCDSPFKSYLECMDLMLSLQVFSDPVIPCLLV